MNALIRVSAILVLVSCTAPASAQVASPPSPQPALRRLDITGLAGWSGEHRVERATGYYDDWTNRWHGTAAAGWYWTPHAKTELELGITSEGKSWATLIPATPGPDGYPIPILERRARRDLTVAVTQQWQFFENAWVHPFVAAGVSVDRIRTRRERQASYWAPGDEPVPAGPLPTEWDVRAHALFGAGLKAYVSERAFFRTELHVTAGEHGLTQVRLRAGFGLDI